MASDAPQTAASTEEEVPAFGEVLLAFEESYRSTVGSTVRVTLEIPGINWRFAGEGRTRAEAREDAIRGARGWFLNNMRALRRAQKDG